MFLVCWEYINLFNPSAIPTSTGPNLFDFIDSDSYFTYTFYYIITTCKALEAALIGRLGSLWMERCYFQWYHQALEVIPVGYLTAHNILKQNLWSCVVSSALTVLYVQPLKLLGWCMRYFTTIITFISELEKLIKEFCEEKKIKRAKIPVKLYELLPKSCSCPEEVECEDGSIKLFKKQPLNKHDRDFNLCIYSIKHGEEVQSNWNARKNNSKSISNASLNECLLYTIRFHCN